MRLGIDFGTTHTVAALVDENIDDNALADLDLASLLADGQQEVLAQAPVEEGGPMRIDGDDLEGGEFADFSVGRFGGGHEAVFRIAVDEDVERLARNRSRRYIASGQQDLAEFAAVEVDPRRRRPDDKQFAAFTQSGHGPTVPQAPGPDEREL